MASAFEQQFGDVLDDFEKIFPNNEQWHNGQQAHPTQSEHV